jgi:hypothetical protein
MENDSFMNYSSIFSRITITNSSDQITSSELLLEFIQENVVLPMDHYEFEVLTDIINDYLNYEIIFLQVYSYLDFFITNYL